MLAVPDAIRSILAMSATWSGGRHTRAVLLAALFASRLTPVQTLGAPCSGEQPYSPKGDSLPSHGCTMARGEDGSVYERGNH